MRIRQPAVQRHQTDLGAVSHQQKYECQFEHGRFQIALDLIQVRPQQRRAALAQHALGGEIQQDGAEQRQRDAHAAQDEIFPRRFQTGRRAIQADQQHGGQRRRFHRHPDDAHVVGGERHQHGEGEQLVHAVIQMQHGRAQLAVMLFDAHVGTREQRGGESDECGQRDQKHIELVDEELFVEGDLRAGVDHADGQHHRCDKGAEAHQRIEFRRPTCANRTQPAARRPTTE